MSQITENLLFIPVGGAEKTPVNKITVVGIGQVGMAVAISLLTRKVTKQLCLVDVDPERLGGEAMDLQFASMFMDNATISSSTDYVDSANSRICVITAGARQKEGESRLALVQRNADIMKGIVPKLIKYSPETILMVVSNPVDIMSYVAWKVSGLPKNRVIGTGCSLDTSRFRYMLAQRLGASPKSVHGYVIGEHGDTSVPVWSAVNVSGSRLRKLNPLIGTPDDEEKWNEIHQNVVSAAYKIIKLKGYTSWAIGLCTSELCSMIINNTNEIVPVSTYAKDFYNIDKDIFISVPCVLNANGVFALVKQELDEDESAKLLDSANAIFEAQKNIKI